MDTVLNWLWQGLVVALATFATLRLLGRSRANARYAVCWAATILIVLLPVIPRALPEPQTQSLAFVPAGAIVSVPDTWWSSMTVLLALWIGWAGVNAALLLRAIALLDRARASSRPFPRGIESHLTHWMRVSAEGRKPALAISDAVTTAAVLVGSTPVIAVSPTLVSSLGASELDRVLVHEWAHVQRRDDLVLILQRVIHLVAGWHPAVWWLDRRLHLEREIACDEIAIAVGGSPKSYAECLVRLADLRDAGRPALPVPAIRSGHGLRGRITRIVSRRGFMAPIWARSIAAGAVSMLCLVALGVGGLRLVETSVFALPLESLGLPRAVVESLVPRAMPETIEPVAAPRRARQASRPSASSTRPAEQTRSVDRAANSPPVESTGSTDTTPAPIVALPLKIADTTHPLPAVVSSTPDRAPWTRAADRGTAVGQKSKDAGLATGRAFTRFGRRIADAF